MKTNETILKINNLCQKTRIVCIILFCISLSVVVFCGVSMICDISHGTSENIRSDGSTEIISNASSASKAFAGLITYAIYGWILLVCANMFIGIKENETPFNKMTVNALNKVSILTFCSAVVPSFFGCLLFLIMNKIPLESLGFNYLIEQSGLTVELVPLFLSLFLFVITAVFKYGCILQQESDETL